MRGNSAVFGNLAGIRRGLLLPFDLSTLRPIYPLPTVPTLRIQLPFHLRNLAKVTGDVPLEVAEPATLAAVCEALETKYPPLLGTIRNPTTGQRRPLIRFYACSEDWSNAALEAPLPEAVVAGVEPLLVVGAIAGG